MSQSLSSALAQVTLPGVGEVGIVEKVKGDFQFTEGPAQKNGGDLYFTDIPAHHINRLRSDGTVEVFIDDSGFANGLMFDAKGRLLACQMDGQVVAIDVATKKMDILADKFEGERFNAPNDLVIDKLGGIYFTDPRYRAPEPWPQGTEAFYYRSATGEIVRLDQDIAAPNGISLSPDEKTLYIIPSMTKQMLAYTVIAPGKIADKRILCELEQPSPDQNGGGDGMTIDASGNLYITTALGVQVFSPVGKLLGIIEIPEHPANVTFGGPDLKTLYVTARTGLYRCEMPIAGHRFAK